MSETDTQEPTKRTFWTTFQAFVAVPGLILIGWSFLAPEELALTWEQNLGAWLAIFAVAAIAGLARTKSVK